MNPITIFRKIVSNFKQEGVTFNFFDKEGILKYYTDSFSYLDEIQFKGYKSREGDKYGVSRLLSLNKDQTLIKYENYVDITYRVKHDEKTIGFINMAVERDNYDKNIKNVGQLILDVFTNEIKYIKTLKELKYKNKYNNAIIKSISDGLIVLNNRGVVTHINEKGLEILELRRKNIINKKLQNFIENKLKILDVIETGIPIYNKELFIKLKNRKKIHIMKTAVPIKDEEGNVIAVIDKFKEIKNVREFVTSMVGSTASFSFSDIIHGASKMREIVKYARKIAKTDSTILIQGASGTGKELFAHAIHNESYRASNPFVIIDCAAIPRELVESELFGYVEGAFTGAKHGGRPGKFELASGGTVFLDEIGEMPLEIQAKFLRVLQNNTITRIGGSERINIDIRVIAATNRNLEEEIEKNNFRKDLFYRINVLPLELPALRERKEDLPELIEYFMARIKKRMGLSKLRISSGVRQILINYNWPGNVRELENVLFRAANILPNTSTTIRKEHLPDKLAELKGRGYQENEGNDVYKPLKLVEREYIKRVLKSTDGNKKRAAEILDISRSTLYRKLKK